MRYSQLFSGSNRGAADVIPMSSVRCGNKLADCLEVRLKKQQEPVFYSIEAPKMSSVHFLNMDNMLLSAAATFFLFIARPAAGASAAAISGIAIFNFKNHNPNHG